MKLSLNLGLGKGITTDNIARALTVNFTNETSLNLGPMPIKYWKDEAPPKGVSNRNEAFKWLIQHLNNKDNNNNNNNNAGVVYIADDDNTYDLDLFVEVGVST
jgi:hypothetical protein